MSKILSLWNDTPAKKAIIDYVNAVTNPKSSDFVKPMKAEPFEAFAFKADGVAVYQLGNFGTAAKMLWQSQRGNEHD